jgi:DNA-directed RNA polymerase specialized sigma24 family protein
VTGDLDVCRRTADYWRAIDADTQAQGGSGATAALQQIADPDSELNRQWDEEHDRYVVHCLLDRVEEEFEPITLQAFRRLALDGVSGAEAAQELGLSVAAVYVAKSRVLARMRQEAEGLIDWPPSSPLSPWTQGERGRGWGGRNLLCRALQSAENGRGASGGR